MKIKKYRIIDSWLKKKGCPIEIDPNDPMSAGWLLFEGTKKDCKNWILEGMSGTDGAERDHYVSLLLQLESGKTQLDYQASF